MKKLITIIVIFSTTSCRQTIDTNYVQQHSWKCDSDDGWVGDWISFDTKLYKLSGDTLYKNDTARAIIVDIDKQLGGDTELTIKLITTGALGIYHEK